MNFGGQVTPAKLLDDDPGLFHNLSYDSVRSAQHWEDWRFIKNLSISELYARGDLNVWLPAATVQRSNKAVWPSYDNRYAIIESSVGAPYEADRSRTPRLAAGVEVHIPHRRWASYRAGWYYFDVTVVVGDSAKFPKKIVTPSRIGFFCGDEVRELRAKKVLKSITLFTSLEEDFIEVAETTCEREIDGFNIGAAVTASHYDREMFEDGSKIVDGISHESRNIRWDFACQSNLDKFVSSLDIHLFKDAIRIGVTEGVELPFSFFDILVGPT